MYACVHTHTHTHLKLISVEKFVKEIVMFLFCLSEVVISGSWLEI